MGMAAMVAAHMKGSRKKEMGEISVRAMVKRQEPFDMIALEPHDATKFQELANQVGLLYSIRAVSYTHLHQGCRHAVAGQGRQRR